MARTVLDWRDSSHHRRERKPCRLCAQLTNLRDDEGLPCHKTCAERELDELHGRRNRI